MGKGLGSIFGGFMRFPTFLEEAQHFEARRMRKKRIGWAYVLSSYLMIDHR